MSDAPRQLDLYDRPGQRPPRARRNDTASSHRAADEAEARGIVGKWTRIAVELVTARPGCTANELAGDDALLAMRLRKRLPEAEERGHVHGIEDPNGESDVRWGPGPDPDQERARARMERRAKR